MFDTQNPKGKVLACALELAAKRAWREITLLEIAEASGIGLGEIRKEFSSKAGIVTAFIQAVDEKILSRVTKTDAGQSTRDVVFDVIMMRFDVLAPYKPAVRSIAGAPRFDPALLGTVLTSQAWMLEAAGIGTSGLNGGLKVLGLASVYASVFRTWLDDDDPGFARTMAALDRRLRRAERSLGAIEEVMSAFGGVAQMLRTQASRKDSEQSTSPAPPVPDPSGTL